MAAHVTVAPSYLLYLKPIYKYRISANASYAQVKR